MRRSKTPRQLDAHGLRRARCPDERAEKPVGIGIIFPVEHISAEDEQAEIFPDVTRAQVQQIIGRLTDRVGFVELEFADPTPVQPRRASPFRVAVTASVAKQSKSSFSHEDHEEGK